MIIYSFISLNLSCFLQNGKLSHEVNFMPSDIRNGLNQLKRQEMNRLRKIVQAKSDLDNGMVIGK